VINIEDMHDAGDVIDRVDDAIGAASRTFSAYHVPGHGDNRQRREIIVAMEPV